MSVKKEKLPVAELAKGMYVCELDRPWLETPFLMQGFLIESDEDIKTLSQYCEYVFIDRDLSREYNPGRAPATVSELKPAQKPTAARPRPPMTADERRAKVVRLLGNRPRKDYRDTTHWRSEMAAARQAVTGLTHEIRRLFLDLSQGGSFKFSKLKQAVAPLVTSIERNPDACMWLARLKNQDSYIYKHSVACSIWAVAFGRELGLPPRDLKSLALGALLMDVGKLKLPRELLNKREQIGAADLEALRSHVQHSLEALESSQLVNQDVRDMVAYHHERHDGSGYPGRLEGDQIPLFARIAGIVDSYDAITSERPYRKAASPSLAIKELYQMRDAGFDAVLVEEFIQAVGLYPAGTLVLLSSGEVAVVLAEGRTRRLKPQVLLLLDEQKRPLKQMKVLNLLEATASSGDALEIVQSLEPGSYGVNSEQLAFETGC